MPPTGRTNFRGPGQWRSQADGAQRPPTIFAELAEAARLLSDNKQGPAQQQVHAAEQALKNGDFEAAAAKLRAASRALRSSLPGLAAGLREIAGRVEASAPPDGGQAVPPDKDDTADHLPAAED
jgi:hypothetical protein